MDCNETFTSFSSLQNFIPTIYGKAICANSSGNTKEENVCPVVGRQVFDNKAITVCFTLIHIITWREITFLRALKEGRPFCDPKVRGSRNDLSLMMNEFQLTKASLFWGKEDCAKYLASFAISHGQEGFQVQDTNSSCLWAFLIKSISWARERRSMPLE